MGQNSNLRACQEGIIFEVIDQEIVVISLATGTYFSLKSPAATVFALLESGCPQEELVSRLEKLFDTKLDAHLDAIASFVQSLLTESIMESCAQDQCGGFDVATIEALVVKPFQAPVIDKFEDMQDLFLLDPVHPIAKESARKAEGEVSR